MIRERVAFILVGVALFVGSASVLSIWLRFTPALIGIGAAMLVMWVALVLAWEPPRREPTPEPDMRGNVATIVNPFRKGGDE